MKKINYLLLVVTAFTLSGCVASIIGSAIRLGFRMGVYTVLIIIFLICWTIINRGKRK